MTETKYLVIDPETRTIEVPDSEKLLGVEFDSQGMRKYFQCPKVVGDGIDLSKAKIYINVQNATTQQTGKDRYAVENFKVDGDNVTFEWVLSRKVTAKKGTVKFNICVMSNDGKEWNTTFAEGTTKEGLELLTPEEVETRGSDYLGALTADATASAETILVPYTAFVNGEKITGTYVPLDTSDATASAENIENGSTAYINGKKVTGSLPIDTGISCSGSIEEENLSYKTLTTPYGSAGYIYIDVKVKSSRKAILTDTGVGVSTPVYAKFFGDAKVSDVRRGKRFTSSNGLKLTGEMDAVGKVVKTGTVVGIGKEQLVIQTGLSSVEKFIMYAPVDSVSTDGVCSLVYDNGTLHQTGVSYGQYMSSITFYKGTMSRSGGAMTYTPGEKSSTNTLENVSYNWIAIGS